jgi:hypothetical protein
LRLAPIHGNAVQARHAAFLAVAQKCNLPPIRRPLRGAVVVRARGQLARVRASGIHNPQRGFGMLIGLAQCHGRIYQTAAIRSKVQLAWPSLVGNHLGGEFGGGFHRTGIMRCMMAQDHAETFTYNLRK